MSRARDLANGITTLAPLASPDFTGTVDLTGTTISLDNDQISGDKVSGGTIGAGTFNGTIGSSATGSGLITMFDQFYLENHFATNNATITPWTRVTASTHPACSPLGTGLTNSSGVFSFPQTGLYLITAYIGVEEQTGGADNLAVELQATVNNSNYYVYYKGFTEVDETTVTGYFTVGPTLINCTNTTNVKFKFNASSITGDNAIRGTDGDTNGGIDTIYTSFTAMRIGISQ